MTTMHYNKLLSTAASQQVGAIARRACGLLGLGNETPARRRNLRHWRAALPGTARRRSAFVTSSIAI